MPTRVIVQARSARNILELSSFEDSELAMDTIQGTALLKFIQGCLSNQLMLDLGRQFW